MIFTATRAAYFSGLVGIRQWAVFSSADPGDGGRERPDRRTHAAGTRAPTSRERAAADDPTCGRP